MWHYVKKVYSYAKNGFPMKKRVTQVLRLLEGCFVFRLKVFRQQRSKTETFDILY